MKTLLATIILALSANTAFADGFYQSVYGNRDANKEQVTSMDTEFTYTPLYLQVTGNGKRIIDMEKASRTVANFTYTPLYLKVIGAAS